MPAPKGLHPLLIALLESWARRWGWDPADVWKWLGREVDAPERFVRGAVDAFFPLVRAEDFGALPSAPKDVTFGASMQTETMGPKLRGRRPELRSRVVRWLREVMHMTAAEWCYTHIDPETRKPLSPSTFKGWHSEGADSRQIPRYWADLIAEEARDPKTGKSAVPATRASWPRGIK